MRQHLSTRIGGRPALGILLGLLAVTVLALVTGCDRTRPYGATQEPVASSAAPAATTPSPGPAGAAGGPVQVADGWKFTFQSSTATSVSLAGTFNDWNTGADPLEKGEGGVWTVVKPLAPGTYQYKFVVNGTDWKEDPQNPNSTDDGYGGKNSTLVVP